MALFCESFQLSLASIEAGERPARRAEANRSVVTPVQNHSRDHDFIVATNKSAGADIEQSRAVELNNHAASAGNDLLIRVITDRVGGKSSFLKATLARLAPGTERKIPREIERHRIPTQICGEFCPLRPESNEWPKAPSCATDAPGMRGRFASTDPAWLQRALVVIGRPDRRVLRSGRCGCWSLRRDYHRRAIRLP